MKESTFNREVARIARRNGVAGALLDILVAAARLPAGVPPYVGSVPDHLPTHGVAMDAEQQWPYPYSHVERAREAAAGHPTELRKHQIDWIFTADRFVVLAEVKISESRSFEHEQMQRYHRVVCGHDWLIGTRHRGLLVVSPKMPTTSHLGHPETNSTLIGVVMWSDVTNRLRDLVPIASPDYSAWLTVIELTAQRSRLIPRWSAEARISVRPRPGDAR